MKHEDTLTTENETLCEVVDNYHTKKERLRKEFDALYDRAMDSIREAIANHPDLEEDERAFLKRLTSRVSIFIASYFPYDRDEYVLAHRDRLAPYLRIEDIGPNGINGHHVSLKARPKTWH